MKVSSATIYTIAKGDYKFGAFALINSLRACGINNLVIVGTDVLLFELENLENVKQIVIDSTWNGTNLKPVLLLSQPSEYFIYFDADVILYDGEFIYEVEKQIRQNKFFACVDGIVAEHEVRRHFWKEIYPSKTNNTQPTCWYYNAGFFAGCFSDHGWILKDWNQLNLDHLDLEGYLFSNPKLPLSDQDTFNAILQFMPTEQMAAIETPDWFGTATQNNPFFHIGNFRPQAFLHCTGHEKPWKLKKAPLRAPNTYDDLWYKYIIKEPSPVFCSFPLSFLHEQWYKRSLLSRLIIKLKSITKR